MAVGWVLRASLATALLVGCVDLRKPELVEQCATTRTCLNEGDPKRDAAADPEPTTPDLWPDLPIVPPDLAPDKPGPDVIADTNDASAADSKETGDVAADLAVDSGPDVAPDVIYPDVGPDLGPDLAPDLRPDTGPDAAPDVARDVAPDLNPDVAPDVPPDTGPDVSPDTSTLATGLLAYYKCDNATGSTLEDSSGKGNAGTLAATATSGYSFPAGKVGKALSLAKASQANVTLPAAMFANLTSITITAWINVTTSQSWARAFDVGINAKIANNTSTGTLYFNLVPKNDGTNVMFAITKDGYGNEQKLTAAELPANTWKHVAVVLGTGAGLYVDGALAADGAAVTLRPRDLGAIDYAYLGKSQFSADPYFDGLLDEVRIYNRALTAAEIKALYQFAGP